MSRSPRGRVPAVAVAALLVLAAGVTGAAAGSLRAHVVVKGDTLSEIAQRHGISLRALCEANGISARAVLRVGQRLALPEPQVASGPGAARDPAARPTPGRGSQRRGPGPRARPPRNVVLKVPDFAEGPASFIWPVEGPVTSPFGRRRSGWHRGLDIKAERGTPIVAAAPGTVVTSGVEGLYGRVVKIEHDDGFVTVYAHNDENLVEVGARVEAGARIATVGRTGRATTDHVHFEIRRGPEVFNPLYLLPLPPRVAQIEEILEAEEEHD